MITPILCGKRALYDSWREGELFTTGAFERYVFLVLQKNLGRIQRTNRRGTRIPLKHILPGYLLLYHQQGGTWSLCVRSRGSKAGGRRVSEMAPSCHWPSNHSFPAASPSTRSPSPENDLQAALACTAHSVGADSSKFAEFGEAGTPLGMLMQAHSWNLCSRELTIEGRLSLEAALVCPLSLSNPSCALLVCVCADEREPAGTSVHSFFEIQSD